MALTVTVDGNDLTDFLQDRSLSAKRNGADFTLIDPSSVPIMYDSVVLTDPAWSGVTTSVEAVGYRNDVPFYRVRATNTDLLPDVGAAPFGISDTPDNATTFGFKDLTVQTQVNGSTVETRAQCVVFEPGLAAGMELEVTSTVHGYSAEVFTIMELATEYPTEDGPTFSIELGLGDYATATTGADDGGPLEPITLTKGIVDTVTDAGCCGDSGGGGGSGTTGILPTITYIDDFTNRTASHTYVGTVFSGEELAQASGVAATWSLISANNATSIDVDPTASAGTGHTGTGVLGLPDVSAGASAALQWTLPEATYDRDDVLVRFKFSRVGDGTTTGTMKLFIGLGASVQLEMQMNSNSNTMVGYYGLVYLNTGGASTPVVKTDWAADTWYFARIRTINASEAYAKVWKESDDEPGSWIVQDSWSDDSDLSLGLYASNHSNGGGGAVGTAEVTIDFIGHAGQTFVPAPFAIEYSSPPAISGGTGTIYQDMVADGYIDLVPAGGAVVSGVPTNSGIFTADDTIFEAAVTGTWHFDVQVDCNPTPGVGTNCGLTLATPDFLASPFVAIPVTNTLGTVFLSRTVRISKGDQFRILEQGNNTDTPVTYVAVQIVRVG